MKHVDAFFKDAPLDQIESIRIKQFLNRHHDKPTSANRCKRLISTMWNQAREYGYTNLPNPCTGVKGYTLGKREVYVSHAVLKAVLDAGAAPLRDALGLAYLAGQRPTDALRMTTHNIVEGHLIVTQAKTQTHQPLRIVITGKLAALLARIEKRKKSHKMVTAAQLLNAQGRRIAKAVLRNHFDDARKEAIKAMPKLAESIKAFWFYDLRATAADDTSDERGDQAASNLFGHDSVKTTQRHYLRRGKIVELTK